MTLSNSTWHLGPSVKVVCPRSDRNKLTCEEPSMCTQCCIHRYQLSLPLPVNSEISDTCLSSPLPENIFILQNPLSEFNCCAEYCRVVVSGTSVLVELIGDEAQAMGRDSGCVLVKEASVRSHQNNTGTCILNIIFIYRVSCRVRYSKGFCR